MRFKPMRHTARDCEHLSRAQVSGPLVLVKRDVARDGIHGDSVAGGMVRNTLAGTNVQEHQAKAWLVEDDFGQKLLLIEFDELREIVFLHDQGIAQCPLGGTRKRLFPSTSVAP